MSKGQWRTKWKQAVAVLLTLALCTVGLAGCAKSQTSSASAATLSSEPGVIAKKVASDISSMEFKYSDRDQDPSYDAASATKIAFSGTAATVEGEGAAASGAQVTITKAGTYVIAGSVSDGQIVVEAADDVKVQIVLAGVDMTCNSGPCIYVKSADKVFLTLADGSVNALKDGNWSLTGADDEPNATVYSTCDLTINGNGALAVTARVKHGISTKDDLKVTGGVLDITAADDALHGKDSVSINGGVLSLTASGDGIKSTKDDNNAKGFVTIDGGAIAIKATDDGIQASRLVRITGGELVIQAGNDALNSDLDILVDGGITTVNAGDDAAHGEYYVDIVSGVFTAAACVEGLEGQVVEIAGGEVSIVASDDALNASIPEELKSTSSSSTGDANVNANANGNAAPNGNANANANGNAAPNGNANAAPNAQNAPQGGGAMQDDTSEDCAILISAGKLTVVADGDGLDSNGTLVMSGGEVYISGPTVQGNGALDAGLGSTITGGTLVATSAGGMEEPFGTSSTQTSVVANVSGAAGSVITLADASGKQVASYTAPRAYTWVIISTPDLKDGESYTLGINGTAAGTYTASKEQQGMGGPGGMQPGGMQPDGQQQPQGDQQAPNGMPQGNQGGQQQPQGGQGGQQPPEGMPQGGQNGQQFQGGQQPQQSS